MAGRRSGRRRAARPTPAFRPSAATGATRAPSRLQTVAILLGVLVVAGGVAAASYLVKPSKARSFDLFYGSMFVDDNSAPVSIDLASGKPSVRLNNAIAAVSAANTADVDLYPLGGGNTLMLDAGTGEFNMVDTTGFVVKTTGGGVTLPKASGGSATAYASGDSAYIVRTSAAGTGVYLVGKQTVSSAVGATGATKARASVSLPQPVAADTVAAAAADGALWLLTGTGTTHAITQLSVPPRSNAGATLTTTRHGSVNGVAAVGSATVGADGSGGQVAAIASTDSVQVFGAAAPVTHRVQIGGTVEQILPAANAQGSAQFLYRTGAGWSLVSVPTTGADAASVTALGIPATAALAVPAQSHGDLYTMDTQSAQLWQIGTGRSASAQAVPGAASYPFRAGESRVITGGQVSASGNRVVFNSRSSYQAEVLFTDGSRAPRVIDKHSAVTVDPAGADALADLPNTPVKQGTKTAPSKNQPKPTTKPRQTINDKINCKTSTALPHEPTLVPTDRAARSIGLHWTYPLLDPNDCIPTTYVVSIRVLTPGAPSTPGQVTVQGEDGVTLTGLFPATEYEIGLTAYIYKQHTSSQSIRVTTGPEGPAAPTNVRATTDSAGNWTVSWNSCGGISQGCVPTSTWYLLPSFCDGRGLSGLPDKVVVAGDPTAHSFSKVYAGGTALLGRGMCFRVQGVSPQGTVGDTSAASGITYSWAQPNAAALTLTASKAATTTLGATTSTTLDLALGGNPLAAVGGVGARVTFTLNTPQGPQTRTTTFDGRSSRLQATFTGIAAGAQYTAQATVSPPNHPGNTVTTPTVTVTTRSSWPALSLDANCTPNGTVVVLSCTLTVKVNGLTSAQAQGELFSVLNGQVVCGSTGFGISKNDFDPGTQTISQQVSLLSVSGSCRVSLQLVEGAHQTDPPVFGGSTSGTAGPVTVDLGQASTLDANRGDFATAWSSNGGSSVLVKYQGTKSDAEVGELTQGWKTTLFAPNGTACGSSDQQPTHAGIYVPVGVASCVNQYGAQDGWTVSITYYDRGTGSSHSYPYTLSGTPPGYIPCTVNATNFTGAWNADGRQQVDFGFIAGTSDLRGCSNWDVYLVSGSGDSCGHVGFDRYSGDAFVVPIATSCDPGVGWSWKITYDDPAGTMHTLGPVLVGGLPPIITPPPTSPPPTTPTPTPTGS